MKKLKIILQSNKTYYLLLFFAILLTIYNTKIITYKSNFSGKENKITGLIEKIQIKEESISISIKTKYEKLEAYMYLKDSNTKNKIKNGYKLGDVIQLDGKMEMPQNNTNFNSFNYKQYLYNKDEFYIFKATNIKKVKSNKNLFYKIKNYINNKINSINDTKGYLKAFILGDNKDINKNIYEAYQSIGISHLFAISGMHVGLLTTILIYILKKLKINNIFKYIIIYIFLYLYIFLTGFSPSVLRVSIFFILASINKLFNFNIKPVNILLLTISIILINNSFIIYNIGFLYSSIISLYLILFNGLINKKQRYFSKLFVTSSIAFLSSIPITLYNYYSLNYLTIIYNLIFVPLISIIIFPLALLTFILPILEPILNVVTSILEYLATVCQSLNTNLIFKKLPLIIYILYYILISLSLIEFKKYKTCKM